MSNFDIQLPIKRLDPTVELPSYAYTGDAGLDLRSAEDVDLAPFERKLISTGLAIAIPDGYAGFVQPRSGLALKKGLSMAILQALLMLIIVESLKFAPLILIVKKLFILSAASALHSL